jgi:O-antigen ligase
MILLAGAALIVLAAGASLAFRFPIAATMAWMLALEAMPEFWAAHDSGTHEAIIAALKILGVALAVILAIRRRPKFDAWNPGFAFLWMFVAGLAHGLFPGLSLADSLRSLIGSAAPFLFGFARLPTAWCRAVIRTAIFGPLFSVALGAALQAAGLHMLYNNDLGDFRLTGPGEAPFLAGFALVAIYAGLQEFSARPTRREFLLLATNLLILLLTGARAPLALAFALCLAAFLIPNPAFAARGKILILATAGTLASLAFMFVGSLGFLRIIGLAQAGQATNLSNRGLTWPYFETAIHKSALFGWGVGAGKVIIPVTAPLAKLLGTNAAHNEFLRLGAEGGLTGLLLLIVLMSLWAWRGSQNLAPPQRWLMRLVFAAFAVHSWTDNTFIATTSSILFIWVSAVFATAAEASKAPA